MSPAPGITKLMESTGLSASDLAKRVDVHPNTVTNWRTGKTEVPGAVIAYLTLLLRIKQIAE